MKAERKSIPAIFAGGGEMGELIRSFDWSKTSIGSPDTWPQSLRIAVRIMLDTPFGMYIAWGNEYIQLYNDGYRPILGTTKHPQALGLSTRKTFAEVWPTIGPMFDGVMQGTPVGFPDFTLQLDRNGFLEECVFDFSYSPIRLENGDVGGVLVTVIETTEKVKAAKALKESELELQFAIEATQLGTWDLNPATNKFSGNSRLKEWFGLKPDEEIELQLALAVIADTDRDKVITAIQMALQAASGGHYDIIYTIIHPQTKKERIVRAKGQAFFNDEGIAYRFNGTLQDVTTERVARQLLTESEQRLSDERMVLYNSFMNAPAAIAIVKGESHIYEFANAEYEKLTDRKIIIGKTVQELFPELEQQGLIEIVNKVFSTGEPFIANEYPVELINQKTGKPVLGYHNAVVQPIKDESGNTVRLLSHGIEVTQQVEARKLIEANEQDLKRYKYMADNATEPFILMRQDGTFAYLNDLALDRWGYTKEEAQHLRVPDVDPVYNDEVYNAAFVVAQKGKLPQFETLHKKKDGTIYPVEVNMGGMTFEGKPHMFAIARDITERKKLEDSLRKSEEKIRSFILQAPVAMCLYRGPHYIIEIVNEALLTIWDKPLDSVINRPVFEVLPGTRDQGFEALLDKVYRTGEKFEAFGIPIVLPRNNEPRTIYINLVYQPYRDADGAIAGIVEVVSDVTKQTEATQQIEASENQFRTFADSIQNLAWIANADGSIYWYNQRWYDYTGTTLEEMQGFGWQKVHHPEHVQKIIELTTELWKKSEAFELTFPLRRHDGEYQWFLTRAYPVLDANGNIERWIGTNTDITAQKTFTEELEEKVAERTQELHEKNLQLENTNAELASFSYVASHDLKEPLRKIQTFSSLIIETENISDNALQYFNKITLAAKRMQNLIDSLLNFSHVNATELIFEWCDLNTIVEDSKNDLQVSIVEKQFTVEYENLPIIMGVYVQISQLITNLLGNAIKYSRPETKPLIKITSSIIEGKEIEYPSANKESKYHAIEFADNGIGFKQEYANKIFELFQRLHGRTEYSGTGIGLGIVKKIVTFHNGFIIAKGEPDVGATFTIYLPTE